MTRAEMSWYFQAYCEHDIVFHALHYSVANHQDRLLSAATRTCSHEVIAHKLQAIRALNTAISELETGDIDAGPVLLAVTALLRREPDEDQLKPDKMLLFCPHMPNADNLAVYGRGKFGQTITIHRDALDLLLDRAGNGNGLLGIESPGLAKAISGYQSLSFASAQAFANIP
jgi:hypothetical protein